MPDYVSERASLSSNSLLKVLIGVLIILAVLVCRIVRRAKLALNQDSDFLVRNWRVVGRYSDGVHCRSFSGGGT